MNRLRGEIMTVEKINNIGCFIKYCRGEYYGMNQINIEAWQRAIEESEPDQARVRPLVRRRLIEASRSARQ
jgi:hypothetical protein